MFLTRQEIVELTDYQLPAAQCRWLRDRGFTFEVGASGKPKVLRAHVESKMGLRPALSMSTQPNFDAIR